MRLRLHERLTFWKRHPPVDLSCISSEDWERLERASRGDDRELTARIMLLAYLAKANGHSTFDAVLPPDLTAEEANRLADQLVIGKGQRRGAPGRRDRLRLVTKSGAGTSESPSRSRNRITAPSIFRLLEPVAAALVALGMLALPWGMTVAPSASVLTLVFAGCALITRSIAPGFSIAYLLAAAAYAEGLLRASLPVDIYLGTGALVGMALWTLLLQPHFHTSMRLRRVAWFGIATCGATVATAILFQVQTLPLWVPLVMGALAATAIASPTLGHLAGPLAKVNLLAAIPTVFLLPAALVLPGTARGFEPLQVAEAILGLASAATAVTLVWRRRHHLIVGRPASWFREALGSTRSPWVAVGKVLSAATVGVGAFYAMCLVPLAPERIVQNIDIYWLVASFAIASLLMLRSAPVVAVFFALAGASYAESVLTSSWATWPDLQLPFGVAFGMWLLVSTRAPRHFVPRHLLRFAVATSGVTWLVALAGITVPASLWIFSLTTACVVGVQRAFEAGLMTDPRMALAAAGFLPFCAELTLWSLGFEVPTYGTTYISFANLLLSMAPLGCILHSLIVPVSDETRAHHGPA